MVLVVISLIIIITIVTLFATNFGSNVYRIDQPQASSFQTMEWMQYIPAGVVAFRVLDISSLASIPGFFNSTPLLAFNQINMNVTAFDLRYGVEVYTSNGSTIHIMALNQSYADLITLALANQSVLYTHDNVPIYYFSKSPAGGQGGAWLCIDRGAIIYSGSKNVDLLGIMNVISSNVSSFFSNDALKIQYLLTSNKNKNLVFSYYAWDYNSNNIDSEMRSVSNSTQSLEVMKSFHFITQQDFDKGFDYFKTNILSSANKIYFSSTFLMGFYLDEQDEIYSLFAAL